MRLRKGEKKKLPPLTCIGLEVFRRNHDHEANGQLIAEHLVGPSPHRTHALDRRNPIVGNQHLHTTQTGKKVHKAAEGEITYRSTHPYDTVAH